MNVEARLADLIGPAAGRLHTARSRNDQVAVDLRLWVKDECFRVAEALKALITALLARAEEHAATVMPGFTHMQAAQPVTFGHHCMMVDVVGQVCETGDYLGLDRDLPRLKAGDLIAVSTAGAYGAVQAGTYNTRLLVPEVLVDGDRFHIVRPRLTYDDLIGLDSVPGWLA